MSFTITTLQPIRISYRCLSLLGAAVHFELGYGSNIDLEAHELGAAGSAAGLVWTSVGGAVQYVECCCVGQGQPDRQGRLMLTGQVNIVYCMLA